MIVSGEKYGAVMVYGGMVYFMVRYDDYGMVNGTMMVYCMVWEN